MPLWGLSKLVSLGLTGLGSTGVGVYFSPLLSETQDDVYGQVYDSKGDGSDIYSYLEHEDKISKELKNLYSKFKEVLKDTEKKKGEKLTEIQKNFQEVIQKETQLESEYKSNEKLIQELEKIFKSLFETNKKKLEFQAALNSFQNYNKLMSQASAAMHEGGSSLKQFICAIENKGASSDCVEKSKEGLQEQKQSSTTQTVASASTAAQKSTPGGGTETSKAALDQLESSKKVLESKLKALGSVLLLNSAQHMKVMVAETLSEQGKNQYEGKSTFLTKFAEEGNKNLEEAVKKSQETTTKLNETYEELKSNYQKGEKIKSNESIVHKHKSDIQNFLCSQNSIQTLDDCLQSMNPTNSKISR